MKILAMNLRFYGWLFDFFSKNKEISGLSIRIFSFVFFLRIMVMVHRDNHWWSVSLSNSHPTLVITIPTFQWTQEE
jgi:hypothetical protein